MAEEIKSTNTIVGEEVSKEARNALISLGLEYFFTAFLGSTGVGVLVGLVLVMKSVHSRMAKQALEIERQRNGNDSRIILLGQRLTASTWPNEDIRQFLEVTGGTIYIIDAVVDKETALTNAIFFHPDPNFKPIGPKSSTSMLLPVCTAKYPKGQQTSFIGARK